MFVYGPHGHGSDSEETETESELSPEELLLVNIKYKLIAIFHLLYI